MFNQKKNQNNQISKQLKSKKTYLSLFVLVLIAVPVKSIAGSSEIQEEDITWGHNRNFETPMIFDNGIVKINFTNLPNSASSVRLTRDPNGDKFFTFSPSMPQNFTLNPGESMADTYTLLESSLESGGLLVFSGSVITEDSSATVRLETEVVKEGRKAPGFLFLGSIITLALITTIIQSRKKRK